MPSVFHEGELAVQVRAGVHDLAARVGQSIRTFMPTAAQEFIEEQPMAVLASVDDKGRVWASLLAGSPGFMRALDDRTIEMKALPRSGDPFEENLRQNSVVGMIVIEFATRRRMRINGSAEIKDGSIRIHANQVYANCPRYIQARKWVTDDDRQNSQSIARRSADLDAQQQEWISTADTFFIASIHEKGGADASHRGGMPGFIRIENSKRLIFPDYNGNTMFQTLGNISVNPAAGLLFIDWQGGRTLQLTGQARIVWDSYTISSLPGAERAVEFEIDEVIEISGGDLPKWEFVDYSQYNPK